MSDVDHDLLYDAAEAQAGYFTAEQALKTGMDRSTLRYHARPGGRYERVSRGIYRLRHFPSSVHEHVMAAWLPLANAQAVVSHASALELYDLSDIIPDAVHVSVPRSKRGIRQRDGVRIHTLERALEPSEIGTVMGLPVTVPERALLDAAEAGAQPDVIQESIMHAIARGLTSARRLRLAATNRASRVRRLVDDTLGMVE